MTIQSLILFLIIGGLAGWIAGYLTKGSGFGLLGNIIVGIFGAFLGGFMFDLIGVGSASFLGRLVLASIGSIVLLFLLRLVGWNMYGGSKEAKKTS